MSTSTLGPWFGLWLEEKHKTHALNKTRVFVVFWFLISAVASTYFNTAYLMASSGDVLTHTLVRFVGSALIGGLTNALDQSKESLTWGQILSLLPLCVGPALCLLCANFFNSVSLELGGITLTYVVKAGIPLVTVGLGFLLGGGRRRVPTLPVLLSLGPIVLGVGLSAVSDSNYSHLGFAAAWASTIAQTGLNLTSKGVISRCHLSGERFQFLTVVVGSAVLLPVFSLAASVSTPPDPLLTLAVAMTYHIEYVLNFQVTQLFPSLHFAVLDVMRRLAIILCGAFLFGKKLTQLNLFGVGLALLGVLVFSIAQKRQEAKND